MEQRIKERFNDTILQEAMRRFGIQPENIHLLDGFESFMYAFSRENGGGQMGEYILRIGHSFRRSIPMIQGEVDWINYLARGGAGVARAIVSETGKLVEQIPDGQGENFLATAFVKAAGHSARHNDWTPEFMQTYGRLLGRIHALSHNYQPSSPDCVRPQWDDPVNMFIDWLPESESKASQRFNDLIAYLRTLPQDAEGYGMIHQDAHGGNFFVDEQGRFTLFDFDDCCYGHYIYDIAMVLFYAVSTNPNPVEFTRFFMPHFLNGYRQENRLDPRWLAEMPHFLKLREIDLYAVIYRSFDVNNIPDDARWIKWYMTGRKERIESDQPYIDFDFMSLAQYLE